MKMTSEKYKITGNLDFIVPPIVPSFVQGEDARAIYDKVCKIIKRQSDVEYDAETKTIRGSSTFLAARVDNILRGLNRGLRVATLRDLSRPEIMKMIDCKNYADTPAIVFRSMEDEFEPNALLIKQLTPIVEQKNGRLELPVLVTGFDVRPSKDEEGYGLEIVARDDFSALNDEKLKGKYDWQRFSNVDERGLPNFDSNGHRRWYARYKGISRLCLNRDRDLTPWLYRGEGLADSLKNGRIIIVRESDAREDLIT